MSARSKLGNIWIVDGGLRITLGSLVYDSRYHTALVGLDLRSVLPWCDRHEGELVLRATCVPYESVTDPPFFHHEIQWCKTDKLRKKVGYVYSSQSAEGRTLYGVVMSVPAMLKYFGVVWLHMHEEGSEEKEKKEMIS